MSAATHGDFDGDGRSDVLWRDANGTLHEWSATASGSFTDAGVLVSVGNTAVSAIADFNGDGREDILLTGSDFGSLTKMLLPLLATQSVGLQTDWEDATDLPSGWRVAAAGDFNGDGKTDVLLRNTTSGDVTDWLIGAATSTIVDVPNAPFVPNDANALTKPGATWHVMGAGDFNGDGRSDVFWQNDDGRVTDWLAQADGSFVGNHLGVNPGTSWHVVGTGDFNGDGRADIMWRNDDGTVTDWIAQADGTFVGNHLGVNPGLTWHLVGIGDYNGDHRDDLLWQNDDGHVTDWLAQADGTFVGNHLNLTAPSGWVAVDPAVHDPVL